MTISLITDKLKLLCHINLLFLRNEKPGNLFSKPKDEYGGDLDNRIKVFMDGLRMPREVGEVPPEQLPEVAEDPFYCLLEDDSLVTTLNIESDTLLGNTKTDHPMRVRLIAQVTIKAAIVFQHNMALLG
jgi:hypothetical protein